MVDNNIFNDSNFKDEIDPFPFKYKEKLRKIANERNKFALNLILGCISFLLVLYNLIYFFSTESIFILLILIFLTIVINISIITIMALINSSIILTYKKINDFKLMVRDENNNQEEQIGEYY